MNSNTKVRVAVAQFFVKPDCEGNLRTMIRFAERARRTRANLLLMPECCLSGYPPVTGNRLTATAARQIESCLNRLKNVSRELKLTMVFGSARRSDEGWFNSAYVMRPGSVPLIYDKVHLVPGRDGDRPHFLPGKRFPTFRVAGKLCAALICMDVRYPEPFRYLRSLGVKAVFMPFFVVGKNARWKLPVLEGTLRCRAAENAFYVVAANVAGPHQAMLSRACDPNGCSLGQSTLDAEDLFTVSLDLKSTSRFIYPGRRTDLFELRAKRSL